VTDFLAVDEPEQKSAPVIALIAAATAPSRNLRDPPAYSQRGFFSCGLLRYARLRSLLQRERATWRQVL
jgi:hypothetical protein